MYYEGERTGEKAVTAYSFLYTETEETNYMEQSPSQESKVTQLVKKFPAFHRTQRFITVSTRAHQWTLS